MVSIDALVIHRTCFRGLYVSHLAWKQGRMGRMTVGCVSDRLDEGGCCKPLGPSLLGYVVHGGG
jgi:hypothetical protein